MSSIHAVYTQNEYWAHSDGDGHFYVINLADLSTHTHKVSAKSENAAHGKLLWDEDPESLGNRGFATSTGEQFLFEVDLATKNQVRKYGYSNDIAQGSGCRGLHAVAYSAKNMHIYGECSGGGRILEFDVSNDDIAFVHQHLEATGALYEVPDGSYVVASNKGANKLHVFAPNGSGKNSSIETDIDMPGHPSTVSFLAKRTRRGDYIACCPLTENLNQNQRNDQGDILCDYYTKCTGATTADDVKHGVCLHNDENELLRQTEVVTDNEACARCADTANFDDNNECVCTPHCGSCDPQPDYEASASGYMCVDLGAAVAGDTNHQQGTLIPDTGGILQGAPYDSSPDCTYGRAYRAHKRGGIYDASVATVPANIIQIINMETMTKKCAVALPGAPGKVVYAPNEPVKLDADENKSSTAAILPFITTMTIATCAIVSWLMM